ncbi:Na-translocating system protein MpsC family protein [Anatilimnocola floriformis]|uniref:Na-translocating system protein MpsC family protein n=1 Tax=Anatilimnocola floriformis TaxID=2948575 RepID=UPI0020C1DB74|nr:Na-translocating system protein MpsC family protein [Anatilimnocola floriformis]
MTLTESTLRVLIVDDNRDGADALGLVVETFGNQVHVTYGGSQALDVATAFRPDLMLIDLAMPDMDGCVLANRFRQASEFARTRIVAITGHADEGHRTLAMKAGFDAVLAKPVALKDIEGVLDGVKGVFTGQSRKPRSESGNLGTRSRLPIGEARRIRSERPSKALTQTESQAAICEGIINFQEEYMGLRSEQIHSHFIKDLLVVRIHGTLTLAERQLGKALSPEKGRDLIKQTRKQLVELARPMLESLVHEVTGVKVRSMHHDISTVTGEEVILFTLVDPPRFG